jgi:hypothetical protein
MSKAGRTYTARPAYTDGGWRPEIIDQVTATEVDTDAWTGAAPGCEGATGAYREERNTTPIPVRVIVPLIPLIGH